MKRTYPWKLGGPWYRQESTGGVAERSAQPILQKYGSADFVNRFLEEPQKSLKYIEEDFNNRILVGSIYAPVSPADRQQGDGLKLFLDSHSRFYLVVCELYCQAPGYPAVSRDQVCEAGFVIRRSRLLISAADRENITGLQAERERLMIQIEKIRAKQRTVQGLGKETDSFPLAPFRKLKGVGEKALQQKLTDLQMEYAANGDALAMLNREYVSEKWQVNPDLKESGAWKTLAQDEVAPLNIKEEEEIYPLYPLIPDPADEKNTARNRTLYFGVVPTFSGDFDTHGNPKFENEHSYSIRCFVRRHKEECPKKSERADCPGEIVWSEATEEYKLAAFADLDGCGHRPVNIQLPDINDLKDQALRGPIGKGLNVRMNSPSGSSLKPVCDSGNLKDTKPVDTNYNSNPGQICFFCIPLITIVALFVLRLFLPIVVFVFQLWFLLKLKICIPPSVDLGGDISADLKAHGPDFMASIEADIDVNASVMIDGIEYDESNIDDFKTLMKDKLKTIVDKAQLPGYLKAEFKAQVDSDFNAAMNIILGMAIDPFNDPELPKEAGGMPQATDGLHYFDRVEPI